MGANDFSKSERVAWDKMCQGFEDNLILSNEVNVENEDGTEMERSGDIINRPMPYIGRTFDGSDQTANFQGYTQLSVPVNLGFRKAAPFILDSKELRDGMQENRIVKGAVQKLSSDINVAVMNVAVESFVPSRNVRMSLRSDEILLNVNCFFIFQV